MNKKLAVLIVLILAVALAVVLLIVYTPKGFGNKTGALDTFAQCLAQKGATMYGAYWCPHCQDEKAAFGDSFQYVNYVECTVKTNECTAAGIESFPTWIFPDGRKFVGEQGLQNLAKESGCVLPAGY
jgi:thiol-disulfide isomerase/thioredoxin